MPSSKAQKYHIKNTFSKHQKLQCYQQSRYLNLMREKKLRDEEINSYVLKSMAEFEQGWEKHEKKLKKYLMNYEKFND